MEQKPRNLTWAFLASMITHLMLLLLLSNLGGGAGANRQRADHEGPSAEENAHEGISVEIITKQADTNEKEAADKEAGIEVRAAKANIPEEDILRACPYFFGGIGLVFHGSGFVIEVPDGYPAARAGILPGDIVKESVEFIKGEVGTPVEITVFRGKKTIKFSLIREKICIIGRESPKQDMKDP